MTDVHTFLAFKYIGLARLICVFVGWFLISITLDAATPYRTCVSRTEDYSGRQINGGLTPSRQLIFDPLKVISWANIENLPRIQLTGQELHTCE